MSITMIGLDTAKSVFQVHGVNQTGKVEIKRKLRRSELIAFFEKQESCTVVMEACGAAHHWARMLTGLGHTVKLIAAEAVKPFVKKGKKNDAADAAAICAAASRPDVKFVPAKNVEQQGILALHAARSLLVKQQTMLANACILEIGTRSATDVGHYSDIDMVAPPDGSGALYTHRDGTPIRISGMWGRERLVVIDRAPWLIMAAGDSDLAGAAFRGGKPRLSGRIDP
jgi:hypothetical protein